MERVLQRMIEETRWARWPRGGFRNYCICVRKKSLIRAMRRDPPLDYSCLRANAFDQEGEERDDVLRRL